MSHDLYGISVALTGTDEHHLKLTCTASRLANVKNREVEILSDLSFTRHVNLTYKNSIIDAFYQFTRVVAGIVSLQMVSFDRSSMKKMRPVCMTVGKEDRSTFSVSNLLRTLFAKDIPVITDERHQKALELLAVSLRHTVLHLGDYRRGEVAMKQKEVDIFKRNLEAGKNNLNEELKELKIKLDTGDEDALFRLIEIAKNRGRMREYFNASANRGTTCFSQEISAAVLWPDYATNDKLKEKFPIYCFTSWDPRIYAAYCDGVCEVNDYNWSHSFIDGSKPSLPFYCDLTMAMMIDQWLIMKGFAEKDAIPPTDELTRKMLLHVLEKYFPEE